MEKIYNFAKKDFFIFASTYVAIIFLVLLCFFPVCRAFERSEQNQAIAEIRDYASSMLGELDLQEQAIFNATRNLYSDRDFTSIYYNSTMLFDLLTDPEQKCPIHDSNIEDHLCQAMKKMMKDNQAPKEQFERIGLAE